MGKLLDSYNSATQSASTAYDNVASGIKSAFEQSTAGVDKWVAVADAQYTKVEQNVATVGQAVTNYTTSHTISDMVNDGKQWYKEYSDNVKAEVYGKFMETEVGQKVGQAMDNHNKVMSDINGYINNHTIAEVATDARDRFAKAVSELGVDEKNSTEMETGAEY